ncbi:MAG: mechanosensitive ion channel family protein [Candidatus Thermoplasmatota archaeon]|nr:mechanosensitive ion channel family protein [Candidatus Thermoplasmatota archaeon]
MSIGADLSQFINDQLGKAGINVAPVVSEIIVSVGIFLVSLLVGWIVYSIFERYFSLWAKKTKITLDDAILANIKKPIYLLVIIFGLYFGLEFLSFLKPFSFALSITFTILEVFLVAFIITRVVNVLVAWTAERRKKQKMNEHILFLLRKLINAVIFIFAFLIILYIYKIDLSGVVVGLGIGGIAIAFALQSILSDAFSAFSIYFDRPFEIGDYVVVGEYSGTVQKICMKSTRIALLQGEELIISNSVLTSSSIRNFKKMKKRRITFTFGVIYGTPSEKLRKILDMVRKIIEKDNLSKVDRVHFKEFGNFSLNFEVVYYVNSKDYSKYLDVQQAINLGIKEAFEKEGIEMAFPTQTIFLNRES